jgi:outer membrane protein, adhesin transport system
LAINKGINMRWMHVLWIFPWFISLPLEAKELQTLAQSAISSHPDIQKLKSDLKAAESRLASVNWQRYPRLVGDARAQEGSRESILKIEQALWTGGKQTHSRLEAEALMASAAHAVSAKKLDIVTQLGLAYFEGLKLNEKTQLAQQSASELEKLLEMIQRRAAAEVSSSADVVLAGIRLRQALAEVHSFEKQRDLVLLELSRLAGLRVVDLLDHTIDLNTTELDAQKFLNEVLGLHPELMRLQSELDASRARTRATESKNMPTLVGGYQREWWKAGSGNWQNDGRYYLAMQFDTGAGLSVRAEVEAALAQEQAIASELQAFKEKLESETLSLLRDLVFLESQAASLAVLKQSSDDIVQSYLRQYQIGRKNWLDVLNAQREKIQTGLGHADVVFDYAKGKFKFLALRGGYWTTPSTGGVEQ